VVEPLGHPGDENDGDEVFGVVELVVVQAEQVTVEHVGQPLVIDALHQRIDDLDHRPLTEPVLKAHGVEDAERGGLQLHRPEEPTAVDDRALRSREMAAQHPGLGRDGQRLTPRRGHRRTRGRGPACQLPW
jgi:hypothetical protein